MYWLKSSVPFLNCPKISLYSDPPASTSQPSKVFPSPHDAFKSALTLVRRPVQSMLTKPIFSPSKRLSARGSCNINRHSLCISSWTEIKEMFPVTHKENASCLVHYSSNVREGRYQTAIIFFLRLLYVFALHTILLCP